MCPHCVMASLFEEDATETPSRVASPPTGVRFGDYWLHEEIAQGGMGTVFRATHPQLKRVVALKIISGANYQSDKAKQRFQTEAEVVATLDHPNIVPVYDVGTVDGRPFYTMKLIQGDDLGRALKQDALRDQELPKEQTTPTTETGRVSNLDQSKPGTKIAWLIGTIARAVHHAHLRGVLHRDLKPSNILLDSDGTPYVADFGLAKRLDTVSDLTLTGNILGTPAYMAPEQASGKVHEMTTAVDVYSLGALLYHCLTGHPPFSGESALEIIQRSATELPPPLGASNHSWSPDLETICFKCLNKNASQRYSSALELAEDLDRWLRDEPIAARPSSINERLWSWVRRHPAAASAISVAVVSLIAFVGLIIKSDREQRALTSLAEERADEQTRLRKESEAIQLQLDHSLFRHRILKAEAYFDQLAGTEGIAYLAYLLRQNPDKRELSTRLIAALSHRQLSRHAGTLTANRNEFITIRHSPIGSRIAAATRANEIHLWDWNTHEMVCPPIDAEGELVAFDFSRAGDRLVAVALNRNEGDGSDAASQKSNTSPRTLESQTDTMWLHCQIWDTKTGTQLFTSPLYQYPTPNLAGLLNLIELAQSTDLSRSLSLFDPSGKTLALGFGSAQGFINWQKPIAETESILRQTEVAIVASDWSSDSRYYAQTQRWGPIMVWDLQQGKFKEYPTLHPPERQPVIAFHPTQNIFATVSSKHYVYIWSATDSEPLYMLRHPDDVQGIAWHPAGTELATSCLDGRVRTWNTQDFEIQDQFIQVARPLSTIRYSNNGKQVFVVDSHGTGSIWELQSGDLIVDGIKADPHFGLTDDFRKSMSLVNGSTIQLTDFNPQQHLQATRLSHEYSGITSVGFSENGTRLFTATKGQSFRIRDGKTGTAVDGERLPHRTLVSVAFSPNGNEFTAAGGLGFRVKTIKPYDMSHEEWEHQHVPRDTSPVIAAGWLNQGRSYFLLKLNRELVLFDSENYHSEIGSITLDFDPIAAEPNKAGEFLLISGDRGECAILEETERRIIWSKRFKAQSIGKAVFSADSQSIIMNDDEGDMIVWPWQDPTPPTAPLLSIENVDTFDVCPVSDRIIASSKNGEATIYTITQPGSEPIKLMGQNVSSARFSPSGRYVLTIGHDKTVRVWEPSSGIQIWEAFRHRTAVTDAAINPDSDRLLIGTSADAFLWRLPLTHLPEQPPSWLAAFAEAVTGFRFTSHESIEPIGAEELEQIFDALPIHDHSTFFSAWARRLLDGEAAFPADFWEP